MDAEPNSERCVKLEILFYPDRQRDQWVVNGAINDLGTAFMMLKMGERAIVKFHDRMEKLNPVIARPQPGIIGHLRSLPPRS